MAQTSTSAMLCIRLTLWSAVVITSVSIASGAPNARIFTRSPYSGSPYHHTASGVATSHVSAVAGSAHAALILSEIAHDAAQLIGIVRGGSFGETGDETGTETEVAEQIDRAEEGQDVDILPNTLRD